MNERTVLLFVAGGIYDLCNRGLHVLRCHFNVTVYKGIRMVRYKVYTISRKRGFE